ncbi:MAG: hypothetical protein K6B40_01090 [Firmicutes bacterium]|nr:hypothetical protein [Bacillota bacterium]
MRVYLVDFENVHYEGLSGVMDLTGDDQVYVFYSNNGKRLTFELHQQIMQSPARFAYYEAAVGGKNALDHQLSSFLGFLIGSGPQADYFIVSKDQGYRHLIRFWQKQKEDLSISLIDNLQAKPHMESRKTPKAISWEAANTEDTSQLREAVAMAAPEAPAEKENHSEPQAAAGAHPQAAEKEENTPVTAVKSNRRGMRWNKGQRRGNYKANTAKTEPARETETAAQETAATEAAITEVAAQESAIQEAAAKEMSAKETAVQETAATANTASRRKNQRGTAAGRGKQQDGEKKPPAHTAAAVREANQGDDAGKSAKTAAESPEKKQRPLLTETAVLEVLPEAAGRQWLPKVVKYTNNAANKADLYNKIRSLLGQKEGSQVYKALRKFV